MNTPNKIITHTAVSSKTHTAKDVSNWHKARWGGYRPSRRGGDTKYAGYHVIIEWDGTVVQCRDYDEEGIHCRGQNFSSIGVCFMGNGDVHLPSGKQMRAWQKLRKDILKQYPEIGNRIYPHRKFANKSCHGAKLSDDYFLEDVPDSLRLREALIALIIKLQTQLGANRMK